MTHQDTLKGRALADKLSAILKAIEEVESRSPIRLTESRAEIVESIDLLADEAAQMARQEFLSTFNLEKSSS